jgi:hypothetical protein
MTSSRADRSQNEKRGQEQAPKIDRPVRPATPPTPPPPSGGENTGTS